MYENGEERKIVKREHISTMQRKKITEKIGGSGFSRNGTNLRFSSNDKCIPRIERNKKPLACLRK